MRSTYPDLFAPTSMHRYAIVALALFMTACGPNFFGSPESTSRQQRSVRVLTYHGEETSPGVDAELAHEGLQMSAGPTMNLKPWESRPARLEIGVAPATSLRDHRSQRFGQGAASINIEILPTSSCELEDGRIEARRDCGLDGVCHVELLERVGACVIGIEVIMKDATRVVACNGYQLGELEPSSQQAGVVFAQCDEFVSRVAQR